MGQQIVLPQQDFFIYIPRPTGSLAPVMDETDQETQEAPPALPGCEEWLEIPIAEQLVGYAHVWGSCK